MPDANAPLVDAMPPLDEDAQRKLRLAIAAPRALGPLAQSAQPPVVSDPLAGAPPVSALGLGAQPQRPLSTSEQMQNQLSQEPKQSQFQPKPYSGLRQAAGLGLSLLGGLRSTNTGIGIDPNASGELARSFEAAPAAAAKEKFSVAHQGWADQLKGLQDVEQAQNVESEIAARTQPKPDKPDSLTQQEAQAVEELVQGGMSRVDAIDKVRAKPAGATKYEHALIEDPTTPSKSKEALFDPTAGNYIDPDTRQVIKGARGFQKPDEGKQATPTLMVGPDGKVFSATPGTKLPAGSRTLTQEGGVNVIPEKADATNAGNLKKAADSTKTEYAKAQQFAANPSPTNDAGLLMSFIGVTKPDNIGRIRFQMNELNYMEGTRSSLGDAQALLERVQSGQRLTPQQRQDMLKTMKIILDAQTAGRALPEGAQPGTKGGKHGYMLNGEFHAD